MKIFKSNQKGVVSLLVILILLLGLVAALYLVFHPQIFRSRASLSSPIAQFVDSSGNPISQTTTASVRLKIVKNSGGSSADALLPAANRGSSTPRPSWASQPGEVRPAGSNQLFMRTANTDPSRIGNGKYGDPTGYQILCNNTSGQTVYRSMAEAYIEASFNRGEITEQQAQTQIAALPASDQSGTATTCVH